MENCAYEDMNNLYIQCGVAMNDAMEITEEALRLNEMTPEQRVIEFGRPSKEAAHDEANEHMAIAEKWVGYKHDYLKCGICGSHTEITKLACFNNGTHVFTCSECGRVEYEKVER